MVLNPSTGWNYRSTLTISSPSADYQMKLDIRRGSGTNDPANGIIFEENHCYYSDMRDVQVNSTNNPNTGDRLYQWAEEVESGVKRIIWIKTNGNSNIYLFVGNSGASEYSDGDDTFLEFDDFSTYSGWTEIHGEGNAQSVDGKLRVAKPTTNSEDWYAYIATTQYSDVAVDVKAKWDDTSKRPAVIARYDGSTYGSHNDQFAYCRMTSQEIRLYKTVNGSYTQLASSSYTLTNNEWHYISFRLQGSSLEMYIEDEAGNTKTISATGVAGSGYVGLRLFADTSDNIYAWFDDFRVRKYASSPPSWSNFGAWEKLAKHPILHLDKGPHPRSRLGLYPKLSL